MNSKIVIVGGGAAGISALSKLLENGYRNVTLLEAENRIGGRIETIPFGANFVDLGAQWVHGEKNNTVYDMVHDYKVLDKTPLEYFDGCYITSEGENKSIGKELAELAFWVLEHCDKEAKANKTSSFGPVFIKKFENTLKNTKSKNLKAVDPETVRQFLEYFQKFDNFTNASDSWSEGPEATSARGYLEYWQCEGYEILNWKDHGYKTLFDFITKKLPNPTKDLKVEEKILLNKEVKNIDWLNTSNESVKIKCSDGSEYDADHVIITASLGVLKKFHKTLFTPELPATKKNAIEGFSIGTVNKIFMEFEKPFWPKDWPGFSMLWTKKDSEEVKKSEFAWTEDVFGIWPCSYQPNILCGWIYGKNARYMETLDDKKILDGCNYLLNKFLSKTMKPTKPVKIVASRWYSNPHFLGAYSYRSLKTEQLNMSVRSLAQPLFNYMGKPCLLFAGEATHDHYYSTVHGAVDSGYREANRIINMHKRVQQRRHRK